MKQEGLKYFTDTHLTLIALLLFFSFFVCMLFVVMSKKNKKRYEELANIPLEEKNNVSSKEVAKEPSGEENQ